MSHLFLPEELEPPDDGSAACGYILVILLREISFCTDLAVCLIVFCEAVD